MDSVGPAFAWGLRRGRKVTRIWSDILGFGRMAGKLLNPDKGNWDLADSAVEPLNFEP